MYVPIVPSVVVPKKNPKIKQELNNKRLYSYQEMEPKFALHIGFFFLLIFTKNLDFLSTWKEEEEKKP